MPHTPDLEEIFGTWPYQPLVEEIADFAIFHLDARGMIVSWNSGAQRIFGFTFDEIVGQPNALLFTLEDRAAGVPKDELERAAAGGRVEDSRWYLRNNGARFFASGTITALYGSSGELLGFAKIARDDTERKRIEEALRISEAQYRIVAETASDAIISIDENSTVLFVNTAAERIFGHTTSEMLGRSLTMLMPEYLREVHRAGFHRYMATGVRHLNWDHVEVTGLRGDGQEFPVELSFGEFNGPEGRIFIGIARDISERKRSEAEREQLLENEKEARHQAEEANRSKDTFLATVSHELRTPLNAILGWANILRNSAADPSLADRALATIERNAKAQAQLIDDLLDMSRIITGQMRLNFKALSVSETIRSALNAVAPDAVARSIHILTNFGAENDTVFGDASRLQQVVWNLLSNAIKFTPEGGTIDVSTSEDGAHLVVSVRDSGIGIDPEFLPYVFDRFSQADAVTTRRHGGLGLGLSIVRQLVELHGGKVSAESEGENLGSAFTVTLPLAKVEGGREADSDVETPSSAVSDQGFVSDLGGVHVLVVEDEADSRELIGVILEKHGSTVTAVSSAEEALAALRDSVPDIIVSDIGMPGVDGYSLIRSIRELPDHTKARIPAVALTAYASAVDKEQAISSGFDAHVAKPVEPLDLARVVSALANGSAAKR